MGFKGFSNPNHSKIPEHSCSRESFPSSHSGISKFLLFSHVVSMDPVGCWNPFGIGFPLDLSILFSTLVELGLPGSSNWDQIP